MSIHYDESNTTFAATAVSKEREAASTTAEEFAAFLRHAERLQGPGDSTGSLREWLDLAEAWQITRALRDCKGNRSAAARKLSIGRRTLYAKMDKLGITPTWNF